MSEVVTDTLERAQYFDRTEAHTRALRNLMGLLTDEDVQALLMVSENTTQFWRTNKKGPPYCKLGNKVFYKVSDLEKWVEHNTVYPHGWAE